MIPITGKTTEPAGAQSLRISAETRRLRSRNSLKPDPGAVFGSPRQAGPHEDPEPWWLYFRQAVGYLLWALGLSG